MYFNVIYTKALSYWASEIDLTDGELDEEGNFFSANLSMAWFEASDRFENEGGDNSYIDLMIWSMNRTLMKVAPAMIKKGVTKVVLKEMDTQLFAADYKVVIEESKNSAIIGGYKGVK